MRGAKFELNRFYLGDCREVMRQFPKECVQVVVTSPPYWCARFYGLDDSMWGGDGSCQHDWTEELPPKKSNQVPDSKRGNKAVALGQRAKRGWFCRKCGGWIGALGLEPDPQLYVEHIVEVMQEVKRVLRPDGTLWLNMGDSYAATPSGWPVWNNWQTGGIKDTRDSYVPRSTVVGGMKEKDLCLIPEQLALALRKDGWWVRSRITWAKDNPMPEGIKDRPTVCDERIWLLSKSQWYYYDADAIREPQSIPDREYSGKSGVSSEGYEGRSDGLSRPGIKMNDRSYNPAGRNKRTVWQFPTEPFRMQMCGECKKVYTPSEFNCLLLVVGDAEEEERRACACCGSTQTWLSHFATFPKRLVEPCILAGSSRMACPKCLAPWRRITEKQYQKMRPSAGNDARTKGTDRLAQVHEQHGWSSKNLKKLSRTAGWQPTCDCEANDGSGRCIVLDPFMGTGTTAVVASYTGRYWVGIEANKDYIKLAERRLELEGSQLVMSYT